MEHLIVERIYEHQLTEEDQERLFAKLGPCLNQYKIQWIHTYLSKDRLRSICAFEGPDAESVRMAHYMAGIKFERVWASDKLTPEIMKKASPQ